MFDFPVAIPKSISGGPPHRRKLWCAHNSCWGVPLKLNHACSRRPSLFANPWADSVRILRRPQRLLHQPISRSVITLGASRRAAYIVPTTKLDFNSEGIKGNDVAKTKNDRNHDDICTGIFTADRNNRTHFRQVKFDPNIRANSGCSPRAIRYGILRCWENGTPQTWHG